MNDFPENINIGYCKKKLAENELKLANKTIEDFTESIENSVNNLKEYCELVFDHRLSKTYKETIISILIERFNKLDIRSRSPLGGDIIKLNVEDIREINDVKLVTSIKIKFNE